MYCLIVDVIVDVVIHVVVNVKLNRLAVGVQRCHVWLVQILLLILQRRYVRTENHWRLVLLDHVLGWHGEVGEVYNLRSVGTWQDLERFKTKYF